MPSHQPSHHQRSSPTSSGHSAAASTRISVGSMDEKCWRVDDGQHPSAITFSADHPGPQVHSRRSPEFIALHRTRLLYFSYQRSGCQCKPAERFSLQPELGSESRQPGLKATRVIGLFDHPLFPMAPVSLATHTQRDFDRSRVCRNGRSSQLSIS